LTADVTVRSLALSDQSAWLQLRSKLWPRHSPEELKQEVESHLEERGFWRLGTISIPFAVFVAEDVSRTIVGFIEVSARPFAPGCQTAPVGYLEGWYVLPDHRRRGVGGALVRGAEDWAGARGCVEMASDTWDDNPASQQAHKSLGYAEVDRVIHYRRDLR